MDFIRPGIVDWKKVKTVEQQSKMAAKRLQEVLGNCNYAVELGKKLNFILVGIGGLNQNSNSIIENTYFMVQAQTSWKVIEP